MRTDKGLYKAFNNILDLIYPPRCPFCHKILKNGKDGCCGECLIELPFCGDKSLQLLNGIKCVSPFFYKNSVRDSLLNYKFNGHSSYYRSYASFIYSTPVFRELKFDCVTWVPLSRKRLRKRGYDQAELIARELASLCGVPCRRLLVKTVNNDPQSKTGDRDKRRSNVEGVYSLYTSPVPENILLVDDIVTTGATLSECVKVLKTGGAVNTIAAAVARHED